MNAWPKQDYASMLAFYGNVGENQTRLVLPYPMRLAWDTTTVVKKITCHSKVHDSLGRIFANILAHYGNLEAVQQARMDLFGGCLNIRKMRSGTNWSIHSWGCAIDLDPTHNRLEMPRNHATMPPEVIAIFQAEDWVSLGAAKNYDFMHFQAAGL